MFIILLSISIVFSFVFKIGLRKPPIEFIGLEDSFRKNFKKDFNLYFREINITKYKKKNFFILKNKVLITGDGYWYELIPISSWDFKSIYDYLNSEEKFIDITTFGKKNNFKFDSFSVIKGQNRNLYRSCINYFMDFTVSDDRLVPLMITSITKRNLNQVFSSVLNPFKNKFYVCVIFKTNNKDFFLKTNDSYLKKNIIKSISEAN